MQFVRKTRNSQLASSPTLFAGANCDCATTQTQPQLGATRAQVWLNWLVCSLAVLLVLCSLLGSVVFGCVRFGYILFAKFAERIASHERNLFMQRARLAAPTLKGSLATRDSRTLQTLATWPAPKRPRCGPTRDIEWPRRISALIGLAAPDWARLRPSLRSCWVRALACVWLRLRLRLGWSRRRCHAPESSRTGAGPQKSHARSGANIAPSRLRNKRAFRAPVSVWATLASCDSSAKRAPSDVSRARVAARCLMGPSSGPSSRALAAPSDVSTRARELMSGAN